MSDAKTSDKAPGLVCTFYSYKGGVGRSMALANVGVLMAHEGHRVLLVDWDLEAPGLEHYFEKAARLVGDPSEKMGVVDLLHAHANGNPISWRDCLLKAEFFGHSLDVLSAGCKNDEYRQRVQGLDWETLFREHRIGNYINSLRDEWRTAYDFVLVDSRTGITDIGDICTVILPDVLVFLFVTNHQSVEGTKDVMARAVKARSKMPVNRSKLLGVPVPARDERDKEYDKSIEWQQIFATEFGELYRGWLPKEVAPTDALNRIFIPYVASWSFGEHLPVIESDRERADPTSLGAAYARLATLLSHRLDWGAIEASASTADVLGARIEISKAREAARDAEIRRAEKERQRQEEIQAAEERRQELERIVGDLEKGSRKQRAAFGCAFITLLLFLLMWAIVVWRNMANKLELEAKMQKSLAQEQAKMLEEIQRSSLMAEMVATDAKYQRMKSQQEMETVSLLVDAGFRWISKDARIEAATDEAKKISSIAALASHLRDLQPENIVLSGCVALEGLDGLEIFTSLQSLNLSGCTALENIDAIKALTSLQTLNLSNCSALLSIAPLARLPALERLDLTGCSSLKTDSVEKIRSALPKAEIIFPDGQKSNSLIEQSKATK
jgi:MinD-like ATPase involved in chromosome partitioning or flagellar assembly